MAAKTTAARRSMISAANITAVAFHGLKIERGFPITLLLKFIFISVIRAAIISGGQLHFDSGCALGYATLAYASVLPYVGSASHCCRRIGLVQGAGWILLRVPLMIYKLIIIACTRSKPHWNRLLQK
jgi:hypothetical protein